MSRGGFNNFFELEDGRVGRALEMQAGFLALQHTLSGRQVTVFEMFDGVLCLIRAVDAEIHCAIGTLTQNRGETEATTGGKVEGASN
jgi:hypothetical protein